MTDLEKRVAELEAQVAELTKSVLIPTKVAELKEKLILVEKGISNSRQVGLPPSKYAMSLKSYYQKEIQKLLDEVTKDDPRHYST